MRMERFFAEYKRLRELKFDDQTLLIEEIELEYHVRFSNNLFEFILKVYN